MRPVQEEPELETIAPRRLHNPSSGCRLIVNADDFGLTSGVNRAIAELHNAGLVTSASLMARAAASEEAIELARLMPTLGVGCHVVLVDGEPVLPAHRIPTLVDRKTGRFPNSLGRFLGRLFTGRIRSAEIEAEAAAQIALLRRHGLRLTHLDSHMHTHVFSTVLRSLLRAGRAAGIHAIRHPFEPDWAVRTAAGASPARVASLTVLRVLESRSRRILLRESFVTTDGTIAMAGTGTLDASTLRSLLQKMPSGTWELVTHPGYNDAVLAKMNTRLRASRDVERQSLHAIQEFPAIQLASFAHLTNSGSAGSPATRSGG
jgi:hopanoid biosynthesis associated protein HpnK